MELRFTGTNVTSLLFFFAEIFGHGDYGYNTFRYVETFEPFLTYFDRLTTCKYSLQ